MSSNCFGTSLLRWWEVLYLLGLVPLELYGTFIHRWLQQDEKLPFLPLMMVSCYSAVALVYGWLLCYGTALRDVGKKPMLVDELSSGGKKN